MDNRTCDILIVGSGGASLRAAIAAYEYNPKLKIIVATKGVFGKSGVTALSCSDRMAFHATLENTEPGGSDAWKYHADDIYRIGGKVSDYNLAAIMAKEAKDAFHYLDSLNVPFVKKNGIVDQFVTDGSDYARACYTGPKTAVHIQEGLLRRFSEITNIEVIPYCMVAKLVVRDNNVVGSIAIDTREKDPDKAAFTIATGAVILATGGGGMMYTHNVFPAPMTGDGCALAYEAGAELVNLEFIQIGIASTATKFNCSGSMMRAIPRLINEDGNEFLAKYFPEGTSLAEVYNILFKKGASWPVSYEHKTHIIDIALYKEVMAGRKVYLDYSKNPQGFRFGLLSEENQARYCREMSRDLGDEARNATPLQRLKEINPASIEWFKDRGIDLLQGDVIEVAACAQHFQGGVKIDTRSRTTVNGLWAAGESAGGQHGANRPGGNALLDCQVYGKIAGEDAAKQAKAIPVDDNVLAGEAATFIQNVEAATSGEIPARQARKELQSIIEESVGIVRTEAGLRQGIEELNAFSAKRFYIDGPGLYYFLENSSMITVAKLVLAAALLRDESRGPHLRFADYSDNTPIGRKDSEWEKYIVIKKVAGEMRLEKRIPQLPD
ncbi:MAG: fumarate reductase/succinate dehydrogenase flavoprotein domain protein [Anaerosporomusa subterranea]|jgi:succinate dehydrogenase / fumarate reductase flavoprotein subunit|nr:fumarate reductase/succinate dehydrogenase flavoprotein domain protein [Anaerosporomusa subterranea]